MERQHLQHERRRTELTVWLHPIAIGDRPRRRSSLSLRSWLDGTLTVGGSVMRSYCALALLAVLIAATPVGSKEVGGPTVILQEERLSVSAVNAPLNQILAEISRLS